VPLSLTVMLPVILSLPEPLSERSERARRRTAKDLKMRGMGQKRRWGLSLIFLTKTTVSLLPQALPLEILRRPPPLFARYARSAAAAGSG
jgi:hypothetical protein